MRTKFGSGMLTVLVVLFAALVASPLLGQQSKAAYASLAAGDGIRHSTASSRRPHCSGSRLRCNETDGDLRSGR